MNGRARNLLKNDPQNRGRELVLSYLDNKGDIFDLPYWPLSLRATRDRAKKTCYFLPSNL